MGIKSLDVPIVEVAKCLGIELISNSKARCFNEKAHKNGDSNPSLSFYNGDRFKCFGCGISGNIYELVKLYYNIDFKEAADWLSNNFGYAKFKGNRLFAEKPAVDKKTKTKILTDFIEICGVPSSGARKYFRSRQLSYRIMDQFKLTDIKNNTMKKIKERYSDILLKEVGLLKNDNLVFHKHKLLIPYPHNEKVYFIKGRSIGTNTPKYIGLSGTIQYPFNIDILLHPDISREHVFICEGEIDCLTLLDHQVNAIAIPGVNGFKEEWIEYFKKYEVIPVFAFDNDESGRNGAKKIQQLFIKHGVGSKIKHPNKKDWNSEEWKHKNY